MFLEELQLWAMGQWEYLLRIVLAGFCGAIIGIERSHRHKEAGLRTHIILAMGAALVVIVSKYGFFDVVTHEGIRLDASRIASNIITGVSFIGAGMIFVRGGSVRGLTTAAGIWTTAAIGMALGAGMYTVGVFTMIIVLLAQLILHRFVPASESAESKEMQFKIAEDENPLTIVADFFESQGLVIGQIKLYKQEDKTAKIIVQLKIPKKFSLNSIFTKIETNEKILEFSITN